MARGLLLRHGSAPSPDCGGRLGWGCAPIATTQILASDPAPIPTFPRRREKEQDAPSPVHGGRAGWEPAPVAAQAIPAPAPT